MLPSIHPGPPSPAAEQTGSELTAVERRAGETVIAVDLGGTKTTAALVSPAGAVTARVTVPTPTAQGPGGVLDAVVEAIAGLPREAGAAVSAVGVGTAGAVNTTGVILSATDALPGWAGTDVPTELSTRLQHRWGPQGPGARVVVQNDVDAHAAGEAWQGAARGKDPALVVAVGTGVGAALVLNGLVHRGAHAAAGEIGHVPTPGAQYLRCGCGRRGHLEAIASGPAVARRYWHESGTRVDAREVAERAAAGEALAARLLREAGRALGRALAGQVTVLDPEVIVLGGGFSAAGPAWWQAVEETLREELIPPLAGVEILPAALGADAALLGAARQVLA
ncbi:ROK family protein [Kineococcus sp. SYSU DK002]|uniref:ROK family protein n=1 Tax=Kineococcus sp. SYSU DK002 TaxID=3383123 RepID=UPI003D7DDD40